MQNETTLQTPSTTSRRSVVKAGAMAAGVIAAGGIIGEALGGISPAKAATMMDDIGILNYALTLEHLEDALYMRLLKSGLLYGKSLEYATTFGAQEHAHVVALTATIQKLGGTPVSAMAMYHFPMLMDVASIISLLVTVEDLGASAYLGAAPLIKDPTLLETAVAIHSVEAQHATGWRKLAGMDVVPFAFAPPSSMDKVVAAVKPFLG